MTGDRCTSATILRQNHTHGTADTLPRRLDALRDGRPGARARDAAHRQGLRRPRRARRPDRHLRAPRRAAQRCARGRARLGRSRVSGVAAGGRDRGDRIGRGLRISRSPGRAHGRAGEHPAGAQHGGLHAVLLLPVAGPRIAAGLVQVGALPFAGGDRSARGAGRLRPAVAALHRDPCLGFDRGDPLPRAADAPAGHRRLERGPARAPGDARLDDRHRCGAGPVGRRSRRGGAR